MGLPATVGELKRHGWRPRSVREEMRENVVAALRARKPLFPGIVGYEETVIPRIINALLARHDFLLLGLRGQAKTRLLRQLVAFLDDAVPVIADSPIHEDPLKPVTPTGRRLVREAGDDLPIAWLERQDRYQEKLATPDVTIADLIGDIDPIKAMNQKLDFANEEVIHYGIVPRSNLGIFALNELPDLQPRIQVGLLNILEEQDFQIRGFPIRMPLDVLMVFTANPEDYTNRGNIITPLKDRIEAQIMTHYPRSLEEGIAIIKQESWSERDGRVKLTVPDLFYTLIEQTAAEARVSDFVDRNSGVSARMPISLLETVLSSMERRALLNGETEALPRVCDLYASLSAITGKIELVYKGEQQGAGQVAEHLIGKAVKELFNGMFVPNYKRGRDPKHSFAEFSEVVGWFESGQTIDLNDEQPQQEYATRLNAIPGLRRKAQRAFPAVRDPQLSAAMEFLLEGLAQNFVLSKFKVASGTRYADQLTEMQQEAE
ncbi:MAG: magnesium chelatase [Candidatus Sumerlaeota bacterium]|nr:magnesium chelatase [Candidatus Sumerlaeota bacterium]